MNNNALVVFNLQIGDMINIIGNVRYLSKLYNIVYLVVLDKYEANIRSFYSDNSMIQFIVVHSPDWTRKFDYISQIPFNNFKKECIYIGGNMRKYINNINYNWEIYNIFEHMNIHNHIFWNCFNIPKTDNSLYLYNLIKDQKYVFMHGNTSNGFEFNINYVLNKINKSKDEIIIIDPNNNQYNIGDKFYDIANQFINHKVHDYMDLIINAESLYLSNSCFFCLAMHLPIITNNCYVIYRGDCIHKNYDYIWSANSFYDNNSNTKKFTTLYK